MQTAAELGIVFDIVDHERGVVELLRDLTDARDNSIWNMKPLVHESVQDKRVKGRYKRREEKQRQAERRGRKNDRYTGWTFLTNIVFKLQNYAAHLIEGGNHARTNSLSREFPIVVERF